MHCLWNGPDQENLSLNLYIISGRVRLFGLTAGSRTRRSTEKRRSVKVPVLEESFPGSISGITRGISVTKKEISIGNQSPKATWETIGTKFEDKWSSGHITHGVITFKECRWWPSASSGLRARNKEENVKIRGRLKEWTLAQPNSLGGHLSEWSRRWSGKLTRDRLSPPYIRTPGSGAKPWMGWNGSFFSIKDIVSTFWSIKYVASVE